MSYREVTRCKICKKIYPNGIPEICHKCGTRIATLNTAAEFFGVSRCMTRTENAEKIVVKRKWFKWIEKGRETE